MTINNNNSGLDLYLSLTPPNPEGEPFNKLATDIHGVPIGDKSDTAKIMGGFLGYSDQDTIGSSLDEIVPLVEKLNVSTSLSSDSTHYLNTLDPAQPDLPPIQPLIAVSEKAIAQGNIGGVRLSSKEKAAQTLDAIAEEIEIARDNVNTPTTNISFNFNITGGNKWLAGNVYVAFLAEFSELQRVLMRNKIVQGEVELQGLNLIVELAKTTAEMIMSIAKANQLIHILTAVSAGISIGITAVGLGISGKGSIEKAHIASTLASQSEKLITSATQASSDIVIAEKEGRKELLQAFRTVSQHQMDKANEAFRASTEAITTLLQTLDKIREGLQQAVAAALRK